MGSLGVLYGAVGLPGIALIGLAPLTATVLGLDAGNVRLLLFIAVLALVVAYLVNIVRVQLAARVNNVAVFAEIIGTVVLSVVVFLAWVRGGADVPGGGHGFGFLFTTATEAPLADAIVGGALIGIFTLVGFEAAADMAEEAVDARRAVPWAMILSTPRSRPGGATALVPYLVYLLTLGGYLARRRSLVDAGEGGFRLGAAALPVAGLAVLWLVAVVAALTLPEAFRSADYVVLAAPALAGLWYVAVLRRRLRDGTAGLGSARTDPVEIR